MNQYETLLQHVYDNGIDKSDRTGVGTRSLFGYQMRYNLQEGFAHTFGDVHIYQNHFKQVQLQLSREPRKYPTMNLNPEISSIFYFKYEDFSLKGYNSFPGIKAPIAV